MAEHLYQDSLNEMDQALRVLASLVPPPRPIPFKDSHVYRHIEQLPQQAIVQKLARLPSGLRAAQVLLECGFFQEQASLQRIIDEISEDILFLSIPLLSGQESSIHTDYLSAFFAEDFDASTGLPTSLDRPMVNRKKIRAYIAQSPFSPPNPSGQISASKTVSKTYSGYVHAASPQIMDMYGGNPPRFHTNGMLGTPREEDHRQDLANYFYRSVMAYCVAARVLGRQPLSVKLLALARKYEECMGIKE